MKGDKGDDAAYSDNDCSAKRNRLGGKEEVAKGAMVVVEPTETNRSDVDVTDLFHKANERLETARQELKLAQENMKEVREQIRSRGYYEPDSLLFLCDGEDDYLLIAILNFLDIENLGKCEMVCLTLKQKAQYCWEQFEKHMRTNENPSRRSPSAQNARERVIRYHNASSLAKRIGGMGEFISTHLVVRTYDDCTGIMTDTRINGCCSGCEYPDLDFSIFHREKRECYETFVRFSRTSDNRLFAEGFPPFGVPTGDPGFELCLTGMDFSNWPEIEEITRRAIADGEEFANDDAILHECMRELTATVIAVEKSSSKASLLIAQNNFEGDGIDNMGDHGFCFPRGEMSQHSHGFLETVPNRHDVSVRNNKDHKARLGMLFTNVTWTDPEDNHRVLSEECHWTLDCAYTSGASMNNADSAYESDY